jgi:hypothetical protein
MIDPLSPLARRLMKLDVATAYEKLVIVNADANPNALADLSLATPQSLFATRPANESEATAALAGLYLWHDYLDDAHELAQRVETPTGSLWHAILHRREGDFSNAKYWYARASAHPALEALATAFTSLLRSHPADSRLLRLTVGSTYGAALTDLVQRVHQTPPTDSAHRLAVSLQQQEWRTLFDWTTATAAR